MILAQLPLALLAGSLTTLSPCVLPLLPLVLAVPLQHNRAAPIVMASGMVLSFALLGAALGALGGALDGDLLRKGGAVLMLLMGLALLLPVMAGWFGRVLAPLVNVVQRLLPAKAGQSLPGVFLLGAALGLIWSPCSGPLLGSVMLMVGRTGGAVPGMLLLGVFGIGAALPLLAAGYLSGFALRRLREVAQRYGGGLRYGFAFLLLLLSLAVLAGWDRQLEVMLLDMMPDGWLALTIRY